MLLAIASVAGDPAVVDDAAVVDEAVEDPADVLETEDAPPSIDLVPGAVGAVVGVTALAGQATLLGASAGLASIALNIADGPPIEFFLAPIAYFAAGPLLGMQAVMVLAIIITRVLRTDEQPGETFVWSQLGALFGLVPAAVALGLYAAAAITAYMSVLAFTTPSLALGAGLMGASVAAAAVAVPVAVGGDLVMAAALSHRAE